jgi:hypothetical protein
MRQVINPAGRKFNVHIVQVGERYGLNDCLISVKNESDFNEPLVEFYDATYENFKSFGPRGQFISRYYLSTMRAFAETSPTSILSLQGDVPEWQVTAQNVRDAIE